MRAGRPTCLLVAAATAVALAPAASARPGHPRLEVSTAQAESSWGSLGATDRAPGLDVAADAAGIPTMAAAFGSPGGLPDTASERAELARALKGRADRPPGADPMLAEPARPGEADRDAWQRWRHAVSVRSRSGKLPADTSTGWTVEEGGGNNDAIGNAEVVDRHGDEVVTVDGAIAPMPPVGIAFSVAQNDCDAAGENGSVGQYCKAAPPLQQHGSLSVAGTIGNGAYGDSSGDFDFYRLGAQPAGQPITLQLQNTSGELDPYLEIYRDDPATGVSFVGAADDINRRNKDAFVSFRVPAAWDGNDFYVMASAYGSYPADPTDPGSGNGATTTGTYRLSIWKQGVDVDSFSLELPAGTLVSADLYGTPEVIGLFRPAGDPLRVSALHPNAMPLPGGSLVPASALVDHDANTLLTQFTRDAGRYVFQVAGAPGTYRLRVRLWDKTGAERQPGAKQRVFLDFDGHEFNPRAVFGGPGTPDSNVEFAPMGDFLDDYDMPPSQLDAVIDATIARFQDAYDQVLDDHPGQRDLVVLNSRDHAFPQNGSNVTRIVIGGTIDQLGIDTIGLAQSVDPGNFVLDELGIVLLDRLFVGHDGDPALFDQFTVADSDKPAFVGVAVGSIAAHEFGHLLGNWHTEYAPGQAHPDPHPNNQALGIVPNIMDRGGDFATMFGTGGDTTFGSGDDVRAHFRRDVYELVEGFLGIEDTAVTTAEALAWLTPTDAYVLGGPVAVADSVFDQVRGYFAGREERLAGPDRYATAAAIVAEAFPEPTPTVYLATGENFPDALAAGAAAAAQDAPVLLTTRDSLPDSTAAQLQRLEPEQVYLAGGPVAISRAVQEQVAQVTGAAVTRLAGENRYLTAARIVETAFPDPEQVVYVATGGNFPDALAGGAAAAREGAPVLLTDTANLPPEAAAQLQRLQPDVVRLLGGEVAISQAVGDQVAQVTGATIDRIAGADRYDTASRVVGRVFGSRVPAVHVATGRNFPDALAGVAAAARRHAPILLVDTDTIPAPAATRLDELSDY